MNVIIENCRNIDRAFIAIEPGKLNLKFAPNGTGKSSIAQTLSAAVEGALDSMRLVPIGWRQSNSVADHPFQVGGLDN